jgi:hypothetical protein
MRPAQQKQYTTTEKVSGIVKVVDGILFFKLWAFPVPRRWTILITIFFSGTPAADATVSISNTNTCLPSIITAI